MDTLQASYNDGEGMEERAATEFETPSSSPDSSPPRLLPAKSTAPDESQVRVCGRRNIERAYEGCFRHQILPQIWAFDSLSWDGHEGEDLGCVQFRLVYENLHESFILRQLETYVTRMMGLSFCPLGMIRISSIGILRLVR
ncbi:unnamed protein product [Linum trigynum]|uniref:Uncharacterized protein n=1 Tax=Linum trigynum TaxID=586398 RepID=A0AAV2ECK2_9ROSI